MAKRFVKGNVYVFTKKKFLEEKSKRSMKSVTNLKLWVDSINGNEVTIRSRGSGSVLGLNVCPEWCKCIKNNNPKIKSEEKEMKDKTINLCDTCKFEISSCEASEEGVDFKFGHGLGDDNVYECNIYKSESEAI